MPNRVGAPGGGVKFTGTTWAVGEPAPQAPITHVFGQLSVGMIGTCGSLSSTEFPSSQVSPAWTVWSPQTAAMVVVVVVLVLGVDVLEVVAAEVLVVDVLVVVVVDVLVVLVEVVL